MEGKILDVFALVLLLIVSFMLLSSFTCEPCTSPAVVDDTISVTIKDIDKTNHNLHAVWNEAEGTGIDLKCYAVHDNETYRVEMNITEVSK